MALFLATHINRIDKKGRTSVPAQFRSALYDQAFQGVFLARSANHACLEGFDWSYMAELSTRLDDFDLFSPQQDDLATAIFGDAHQIPFDGEGRIMLSQELVDYAGIEDRAAFVGLGRKFQLWNPEALEARRSQAHHNVREKRLTVPKSAQGGGQ
jgi:MraZ protein